MPLKVGAMNPPVQVWPAVAASLLLLSGCISTEYGPLEGQPNGSYGYRERLMEDGRYTLLAVHPSNDEAHAIWDRRARELCGGEFANKNIFRAVRPTVLYQSYGGMPGLVEIEGYLTCRQPEAPVQPGATDAPG